MRNTEKWSRSRIASGKKSWLNWLLLLEQARPFGADAFGFHCFRLGI